LLRAGQVWATLSDLPTLNNMNENITHAWTFASDSNPNIEYETLQYVDGSTSWNCNNASPI
jgi:hypothetical protein